MNVVEMHLAIQQGVDKINSLQADLLLPQEIDIELNKSMSKFINLKYGKNNIYRQGFEQSQKRIDDLRSLVTEYSAPVIFKEQYNNNVWIDQFKLPYDYLYLINQRSEVLVDNCTSLTYSLSSSNPIDYFVLPVSSLHNGTELTDTIAILADIDNPATGSVSVAGLWPLDNYPQDIPHLVDFLLDSNNWGSGIEVYWESYGNLYHPNSFIVIIDSNVHTWFNWDSSVGTQSTLIAGYFNQNDYSDPLTNSYAYAQHTDNAVSTRRVPDNTTTKEFALNKFIQQDDIFKLLDDPFNATKHTAPLTTIRGEYIDIYTNDIFIIDKVKITYIRKPKQISLSLGISCELPEHTHQEIVDMTVSSILEGISDPRYQNHQLEVGKNE